MLAIGSSRTATVRDVSRTGLRLEVNVATYVGQEIWLKFHPFDVFGRVKWVNGNQCGVELDQPFTDREVRMLKAKGETVWMPRLSKDEQLALHDWRMGTL